MGHALQFLILQWNTVHCTAIQCSDQPVSAVSSLQHSAVNYTGAVHCSEFYRCSAVQRITQMPCRAVQWRELYRQAPLHSHYTLDFTRWLLNEPVVQKRIWLTTKMSDYKYVTGIAIFIRPKWIRLKYLTYISYSQDSNPELSCLFLIFGLGSSSWQRDRRAKLGNIWQYSALTQG